MASDFDESDFVDRDFQAAQKAAPTGGARPNTGTGIPPSREELGNRVAETQHKLAELKRMQEELERERTEVEEARRRSTELKTGREEMLRNLTRGLGLLEETELASRREAEQAAKNLVELRQALDKVQAINESEWTEDNWSVELTRALTSIENARMEWNAARLKWPILDGNHPLPEASTPHQPIDNPGIEAMGFWQLCRIGLAFTWLLVTLAAGMLVVLVILLSRG